MPQQSLHSLKLSTAALSRDRRVAVYRQISGQIARLVSRGRLKPGERLPTHDDLAKDLGVHPLTVSKAYSELQARGLIKQQRGRGTFVRARVSGDAGSSVVILLPDWGEISRSPDIAFMNNELLAGIEQRFRESQVGVRILTIPEDRAAPEAEIWSERIVRSHRGVIAYTPSYLSLITRVAQEGVPAVIMQHRPDRADLVSSVIYDRKAAFQHVTEHLIRLGRRRISYLGVRGDEHHFSDKFNGYLSALEAHRLPYDPVTLMPAVSGDQESYRRAVESAVREKRIGDAIVVDAMHAGRIALEVLTSLGVRVPQDVALVGNDEQHAAPGTTPPLTWLYVPRREMGQAAASILVDRLDGSDAAPAHLTLNAELILGASCGQSPSGEGRLPRDAAIPAPAGPPRIHLG
jgi:DNA-binding LacI/PurR family transcriptional regulator